MAKNTFLSQKYKYDLIERKAADMLWNWPLLDGVDKIGMEGCKDDVSRWRRGYGWYFRNLFSAHEGELIVLQDRWKCMDYEDIDEVFFHEQFALNQEQWQEAK